MEYQNLSKNTTDISLYYKYIDENIFNDKRFIELMNLVSDNNLYKNIRYACYCDSFLLRKNIFIPNFHTIYLSNNKHNVILGNPEESWLIDIFPNNQYYLLANNVTDQLDNRINIISSIKNLMEVT